MRQLLHGGFKIAAMTGETYIKDLHNNRAIVSRCVSKNTPRPPIQEGEKGGQAGVSTAKNRYQRKSWQSGLESHARTQ